MSLDDLIKNNKIIITCGSGGVGKTTIAAAIACRGAILGKKVVVLTIDPAKRLATSLGLDNFDEEARDIPLSGDNGDNNGVYINAMMLNTKNTFDRLVERYSKTREQAEKILANKFYRHFSGAVGGTHEYTAMERLYELTESGKWDLLVLDTPPTVHALDFLDAPQKMIDLFDESIFKWIIKPYLAAGRVGIQVISFGSAYIFKTLTRFVGGEMLQDLSDFLFLFQDLFEGFNERAKDVVKLLNSDQTSFVIVATPQENSLKDATTFKDELVRMQLKLGAFLINRCLFESQNALLPLNKNESKQILSDNKIDCDGFLNRLINCQKSFGSVANQQQKTLKNFFDKIDTPPQIFCSPLLESDVSDISSLVSFAKTIRQKSF